MSGPDVSATVSREERITATGLKEGFGPQISNIAFV